MMQLPVLVLNNAITKLFAVYNYLEHIMPIHPMDKVTGFPARHN